MKVRSDATCGSHCANKVQHIGVRLQHATKSGLRGPLTVARVSKKGFTFNVGLEDPLEYWTLAEIAVFITDDGLLQACTSIFEAASLRTRYSHAKSFGY